MLRISILDQTSTIALRDVILPWVESAFRYCDLNAVETLVEASEGNLKRVLVAHNDKDALVGVFVYEFLPETMEMVQLSTTYNGITFDETLELMKLIADMFRNKGITRILGKGRKGWKRQAPKLGWKELEDGIFEYKL